MALLDVSTPEFGSLLRGWRQHRRLTQLDLAAVAEVSTRHLSFLETGRAKPSREMVLHLGRVLDVPLRERNELLLAAGFAPAYGARPLEEVSMQPVKRALSLMLAAHEPYPALVVDRHWNLVSANPSAFLLTEGVDEDLLTPPVNVVRISVHPRGLAGRITNFDQYASHLLSRLRRQVDRTADPALVELLDEVLDRCGSVRAHSLPLADEVVIPLRIRVGGEELSLFSTIAVLGAPRDVTLDELAIEAFYPADEQTETAFRERAHARA